LHCVSLFYRVPCPRPARPSSWGKGLLLVACCLWGKGSLLGARAFYLGKGFLLGARAFYLLGLLPQAGETVDPAFGKAVGQFMSEVAKRDLTIGRIFPERFFAVLKALSAPAPKAAAAADARAVELAGLFAGEFQKPIVAWLGGDEGARDDALEMMGYAGEEGLDGLSPPAQRARALQYVRGLAEPYVRVAQAIAKGFAPALAAQVRGRPAAEVCCALQGSPIDADDVASRFVVASAHAVVAEKVRYIKEHLRERIAAGDADWAERFLFCVTGQRALKASSTLTVCASGDALCRAHTCMNTLDLPTTHETPPLDVADRRERCIRNLEMTMAEAGFSMS
jgi:hypothetical protein